MLGQWCYDKEKKLKGEIVEATFEEIEMTMMDSAKDTRI